MMNFVLVMYKIFVMYRSVSDRYENNFYQNLKINLMVCYEVELSDFKKVEYLVVKNLNVCLY